MKSPRFLPDDTVATVIPARTPFRMEYGALYWGNTARYLAGIDAKHSARESLILAQATADKFGKFLPFVCTTVPRLIAVPAMMGIDISSALHEAEYKCNYTGREHWALCPVALLLAGDETPYRKAMGRHHGADVFFDPLSYISRMPLKELIPDVARMDLGAGYTEYCNHFDGSPGEEPVLLDLDNGDRILAVAISWFNK